MSIRVLYETGFEEPFHYHDGISELEVPLGWLPVWVQGEQPGVNHRPEWKPEGDRVHSGERSAKFFTTHSSHDAALVRVCALPIGAQGAVWAEAWGATFRQKAGQALRVGIDPTGGVDLQSERVVWSEWWGQYNGDWAGEQFHQFALGVTPESNLVSVFLHSRSLYAAQTVAAYWDDMTVWLDAEEPGPGGGGDVSWGRVLDLVEVYLAEQRAALGRVAEAIEGMRGELP